MTNVSVEHFSTAPGVQTLQSRWWSVADKGTVHQHVFGIVNAIETQQSYRHNQNIKYARLYSNYDLLGFWGTMFSRAATQPVTSSRVALNVVKSCVDTATAKIGKARPRPMFLTEGGNWTLKRRAKLLTKYVEGVFDDVGMYQLAPKIFRDGCVLGTGAIKFYKDEEAGKIRGERVLSDEIVVDDAESVYGAPRSLHQRRFVSREILLEQFPDSKNQIRSATGGIPGESSLTAPDQIKVVESWHLRSGANAKDGRHTICVENCTLFEEKYEKDYFPFVFFRWSPRLVGFYGAGLSEELVGIQIEINRILRSISESQRLMCVPRVFIDEQSSVNTQHLSNEIGAVVKYRGNPPSFNTAPGMSPEVYQHLWQLYAKAFEITGISQLSANAKKPGGLDSGIALREYQDIESERFVIVGQTYEQLFMDAAEIIVDMSRDLYARDKNLSVKVKGSRFLNRIKWKDVDLEDDKFVMKVFPTSILPSTPGGKLQTVQELIQAGFIDKEAGLSLLDFPDLEGYMNLRTAALDDIAMMLERMVDDGVYQSPEPYMNLESALPMAQSTYLRGRTEGLPEDRLELLRRFMDDVQELRGLATPPPAAPAGEPPIAEPEAPPTSELLPAVAS